MTENLYQAHAQWVQRPADERFANLDDLLAFTSARKANCREDIQDLKSLSVTYNSSGELILGENGSKSFVSNWAFGQLCRMIGAPASYLRTLPSEMVRDCVRYGLDQSAEESLVLRRENVVHSENAVSYPYISALTSPHYGRIWDADVVESVARAVHGSSWRVPVARTSNNSNISGLYASDHDMFAFFVSDDNPVWIGDTKLGKGFFCWNSETGASTFGLTTFLWNYICGNHIIWGAEEVNELKIIHRVNAPERFYNEALPYLDRFVENRHLDLKIRNQVEQVMEKKIGENLEQALGWFKDRPFTKKEVSGAWQASLEQGEDPTRLWGMVQGLTSYSKDYEFADRRVDLDKRAGALLGQLSKT